MDVAVIINDSFGRAWRNGVAGVAIGVSGIPALVDVRGNPDRQGRPLEVTQVAAAMRELPLCPPFARETRVFDRRELGFAQLHELTGTELQPP